MSSRYKYIADVKVETAVRGRLREGTIRTKTKCCDIAEAPHIADLSITPVGALHRNPLGTGKSFATLTNAGRIRGTAQLLKE